MQGETSTMKKKPERLAERPSVWGCPHGPVGLHNIGETCCLNSLIQVLIMNVGFTKILKRITVPRGAEEQRRSVPFQLLLLLEKMQDSRQKAVRPTELAYCLQKYKIPMFIQYDAAQLYLIVWNLIKDQIPDGDLAERLQALYTIRMTESLLCLECTEESSRNTSMLTLPLPVFDLDSKPLKTLEDALRCFFQPRELLSNSRCFCERCGRKTCRKQVLKLTHLPQTLTIHLMRFATRNLQTEKICHSLCFPQSLDLNQVLLTEHGVFSAEGQVRRPLTSLPSSVQTQTPHPPILLPLLLSCLKPPTQQRGHFWVSHLWHSLISEIMSSAGYSQDTQREDSSPGA